MDVRLRDLRSQAGSSAAIFFIGQNLEVVMKNSRSKKWIPFLVFVVPTLILYTYFIMYSICNTAYYSLTKWNAISDPEFVGLYYYMNFLKDKDFHMVLINSLKNVAISLAIQIPAGLIGGYLLFQTRKMYRIYRFLMFVPVVLSASAIALLFSLFFSTEFGPVNAFLSAVGLESLRHTWLTDTSVVFYVVMVPMTYQYIGIYVITELSGMQAISEAVIESAKIDGANSFRIFWNIVRPLQKSITLMCSVLIISGCFKAFEHSYIMTWGGPGYASSFLGVYMYTETFVKGKYGKGSAISMVILILSLLFTFVVQTLFGEKKEA